MAMIASRLMNSQAHLTLLTVLIRMVMATLLSKNYAKVAKGAAVEEAAKEGAAGSHQHLS
jgi:hypothetical protein